MALEVGSRLGVFEVTGRLGEGGMGVVYRATDTTLNRDVALKVLPDAFATDPERLARFEREAKVLASLNHPNIAAIYGLEKSGDTRALILELVEGPTLQDRIAKGPIPLDEALPIARQIAEALEAAHEQGIIHRDLKPANVKVKADGTVKVLDFGLAKALQPDLSDLDAANSPTMTMTAAATKMGVIMGTAAYMSPEQAAGKTVDRRADIWAFGALLWEMLTGRQLFDGETVSHVLAAVLTREIAWADLPAGVPPELRRLLRRCLDRDAKRRLRDVGEARVSLDDAGTSSDPASAASDIQPVAPPALWQRPVPLAFAALLLVALGGLAVWALTRPAPPAITRFPVTLPPDQQLTNTGRRVVAISPSGSHVVYVANDQLYLRPMDQTDAVPIPGTGGTEPTLPTFSPDGQWVAFYSNRDNQFQKIAISGGAAVRLFDTPNLYGATWGEDDLITYALDDVFEVRGTGGTPELLIDLEGERAQRPQRLPDGQSVLFTVVGGEGRFGSWDTAQIVVQSLETGERRVLIDGGSDARYLPTGHLVYALGDTLLAVPFDVDRLEVAGGPVPLVQGVARATFTGGANFDVSETGSLVYLGGSAGAGAARSLVWVDREGREEPLATPVLPYGTPSVSPDGTRVAVDVLGPEDQNIWIHDLSRGTETILTTDPAEDDSPLWTPDGEWVVFASDREGQEGLFQKRADTPGDAERLMTGSEGRAFIQPMSWSADGQTLLFRESGGGTPGDIGLLSMEGDQAKELLLDTEFSEAAPAVSPDGGWIAYDSNETGEREVYVQRFPGLGSKVTISTDGGGQPLWSPDGRELFYRGPRGMMVVPVETEATFGAGDPSVLFETQYYFFGSRRTYDLAPDGQRFLMLKEGAATDDSAAPAVQIHVVLNWFEELLERVPVP